MSLSLKPQQMKVISGKGDAWYYETEKGIEIIHEIRFEHGSYFRSDNLLIPWDKIRKSMKRKDHK